MPWVSSGRKESSSFAPKPSHTQSDTERGGHPCEPPGRDRGDTTGHGHGTGERRGGQERRKGTRQDEQMWGFGAALEPQRGAGQGDGAVKAGTAESTRETAAPRQMESSEHSQRWDEPVRNSVGQRGRTTGGTGGLNRKSFQTGGSAWVNWEDGEDEK